MGSRGTCKQNPHTCCSVLNLSLTRVSLFVYLPHHVAHLILHWKHLWREHFKHVFCASLRWHFICLLGKELYSVKQCWSPPERNQPEPPLISPTGTHGWHKINLLPVIQRSYSVDLHIWKLWGILRHESVPYEAESMRVYHQGIQTSSAGPQDLLQLLRWMSLSLCGH